MGTRKGYRVTVTDRTNNRRVAAFNVTGASGSFSTGSTRPPSLTRKKKNPAKPKKRPSKRKSTPGLEGFSLQAYDTGGDR